MEFQGYAVAVVKVRTSAEYVLSCRGVTHAVVDGDEAGACVRGLRSGLVLRFTHYQVYVRKLGVADVRLVHSHSQFRNGAGG